MPKSYYHSTFDPLNSISQAIHPYYDICSNKNIDQIAELLLLDKLIDQNKPDYWNPQHSWLIKNDGSLASINFIGKYENIQEDYLRLCKALNIIPEALEHLNKSTKYSNKINPSLIKELEKYYKFDFELFGY